MQRNHKEPEEKRNNHTHTQKNHKKLRSLKRKKKKNNYKIICFAMNDFNLVLLRFKIDKYAAATNVLLHP